MAGSHKSRVVGAFDDDLPFGRCQVLDRNVELPIAFVRGEENGTIAGQHRWAVMVELCGLVEFGECRRLAPLGEHALQSMITRRKNDVAVLEPVSAEEAVNEPSTDQDRCCDGLDVDLHQPFL